MEHQGQDINEKRKELRRSKRKDWSDYAHNMLTNELDLRDKWLGFKYLKNNFRPTLFEAADQHGNKVGYQDRAAAASG